MSEPQPSTRTSAQRALPSQFEPFYRERAESLLVYFARRTLDPDIALELAAETFAQAYANRGQFRGSSPEEAGGWIFAIARNQLNRFHRTGAIARRHLERLGLETPTYTEADLERVEHLADLTGLRKEVGTLFDTLPARQRAAIQLRVVEECSYDEVASRLQITEETARARVSRGLRRLRSQFPDPPKEMLA